MSTLFPYAVPGIYYEPRPRRPPAPIVRTDVVGFVGFEPRVRDGSTPSALVGAGHAFRVDVAGFRIEADGVRGMVPAIVDFPLSVSSSTVPIVDKKGIAYALAAVSTGGAIALLALAGSADDIDLEKAPDPGALRSAAQGMFGVEAAFVRIADVVVRRRAGVVWLTIRPALPPAACDDERDFQLAFGAPVEDGTLLAPAVRAFFANGGRRCWITTVRRPDFGDTIELERALNEFVGIAGTSELESTGLERLLLLPEVTVVDVPDLYAAHLHRVTRSVPLAPPEHTACFAPCGDPPGSAVAVRTDDVLEPLFTSSPPGTSQVFRAQRDLLARCLRERWRVLLLFSVPRMADPATGLAVPPNEFDAHDWVVQFDTLVKNAGFAESIEMSAAALYWPWVYDQIRVGAPVRLVPPSAYAAGIVARRDLARGPQFSPANEVLRGAVGVAATITDAIQGELYEPEPDANGRAVPSVNVIRTFPGGGLQMWGARTLSTDPWFRFLSVRRTLTAVELRMKVALDAAVFEPNSPVLWMQVTTAALSVLVPLFESGALRGDSPEDAFYVRCDETVNPPESIALGEFFIEVGVAAAAPVEYIVFRVGRKDGVIEVLE